MKPAPNFSLTCVLRFELAILNPLETTERSEILEKWQHRRE
jgi:hypothetical protein